MQLSIVRRFRCRWQNPQYLNQSVTNMRRPVTFSLQLPKHGHLHSPCHIQIIEGANVASVKKRTGLRRLNEHLYPEYRNHEHRDRDEVTACFFEEPQPSISLPQGLFGGHSDPAEAPIRP